MADNASGLTFGVLVLPFVLVNELDPQRPAVGHQMERIHLSLRFVHIQSTWKKLDLCKS